MRLSSLVRARQDPVARPAKLLAELIAAGDRSPRAMAELQRASQEAGTALQTLLQLGISDSSSFFAEPSQRREDIVQKAQTSHA